MLLNNIRLSQPPPACQREPGVQNRGPTGRPRRSLSCSAELSIRGMWTASLTILVDSCQGGFELYLHRVDSVKQRLLEREARM